MPATKVLVVDDSFSMRVLYTTALESCQELVVIGSAASADEAREMIAQQRPDVITLDVEMPGMNGLDFLEELMKKSPLPVIMVSSHTQEGSDVAVRAKALGAAGCVPKLRSASPDETARNYAQLCEIVLTVAKAPLPTSGAGAAGANAVPPLHVIAAGDLRAAMTAVLALPADGPATILLARTDRDPSALVAILAGAAAPKVVAARDGQPLARGTVHVVADLAYHAVIDVWPGGAIRLVDRPPVLGARPSADLLLAAVAKTAGAAATVHVLGGLGNDGTAGMEAIRAAGGTTQVAAQAAA